MERVLLLDYMQKWGGSTILYLSKDGLEKIAEKVNPFWKDAFLNLSELKQETGKLVDSQHVLSQPIWLNSLIKIGGNMCMNKICCENVIFFVNDLISENKILFKYEESMNHYNIRLNFIEYFIILSAIPHRWKLLIRGIGKLKLIENDIVDRLKRTLSHANTFQNNTC